MNIKKWTKKENSFIKENHTKMLYNDIAIHLGRTFAETKKQSSKLGLSVRRLKSINSGDKFGRLTLIKEGPALNGSKSWYCNCDCGLKNKLIRQCNLGYGNTISCGCYQKESKMKKPGIVSWNSLFNSYQKSSNKRNYSFELTIDQFIEICSQNCNYCNDKPSEFNFYLKNNMKTRKAFSKYKNSDEAIDRATIMANGIDRINNNKGYIIENCVPCCKRCNLMKSVLSEKEFYAHIEKILNYRNQKGNK